MAGRGNNQGESKASENRIAATMRHKQALELRMAGYGYQDIADRLGYKSTASAYDAIQSALKKTLQEPSDKVRELEIKRLDAMLAAIWVKVKQGNEYSIDRALKIMARRAEYLGLDAPKEVKVQHEMAAMANRVASDLGLDAADVLAEAERILVASGQVD